MNRKLNTPNKNVTVVIDVSFTEDIETIRDYIINQQGPVIFNLNDERIIRFEWYINELDNTATLIEKFENSNVWEELGNKVLGSPINIRFRELFKVEKLTVLGEINDSFKEKIQAMNPIIKSYVGGINQTLLDFFQIVGMKKWDFKNNPLFFTMLGMLIGSAAGYIEEWTSIPQIISVAVGFIIVMIPLFFWIKDWLKKKKKQLEFY